MEIDYAEKEQAIESASPIQKELYFSKEAGTKLGKIVVEHGCISDKKKFFLATDDVILGLVPQEKLPDLFIERMQITRPEAMKLTADVLDFLAPLGQTAKTPAPAARAPQPAATPIVTDEALAAEIAATEAALETVVQPMRTMAHDMETARQPDGGTHQASSQADLLKK